jgi:hypothetical protein
VAIQPSFVAVVVVLTCTLLVPVGPSTRRSYTVGSIGNETGQPRIANQLAATNPARDAEEPEIGLELRHFWRRLRWPGPLVTDAVQVTGVQPQSNGVSLDMRLHAATPGGQPELREHFLPRAGFGDRLTELRVGPPAFSPEVGCIEIEFGRAATHDPDRTGRFRALTVAQHAHDRNPVGGRPDSFH